MKSALASLHAKILSVRKAAQRYNVNYSTLQRYSSGKYPLRGPPTELTATEENEITEWVVDMSRRGFPLTQSELKDSVQMYLNRAGRETKFKENRPGQKWLKCFMKRHPVLSIRMAENIDKNRAGVTENMIRNWFAKVRLLDRWIELFVIS